MHRFIYAALGVGAGAAVSWAVTADIYEKKAKEERFAYAQLLADKTEHIWALQQRLDNPLIEHVDELPGQLPIDAFEEKVETAVQELKDELPVEEPTEDTGTPIGPNVQTLIDEYTADPDAQEHFAQQTRAAAESEHSAPYVISRDEYAYGPDGEHYEKITLTYYPRERVLLDDDDPVTNIVGDIGWKNLNQFGGISEDPEVVYIRNDRMETDFEVVKEEDAPLPLHIKYGMDKEEFRVNKAAGTLKLREEDE